MTQQQQDPAVNLSLPLSVVNYVLTVVADRPFKESAPVMALIQQQAQQAVDTLNAPASSEPAAGSNVVQLLPGTPV